ncbi:hypothetical protein [Roseospira goensis]|uniref:Uncharacterized protein n=1 Tax=Roseospira goensis TaxID=391922 RepID=A0A7W6S0U9_9PROT|nr:hypothetical protein [Roseospira goensis]MBB4286818.1 hypothetical protein [Roseospira goensis]
MIGPADTCDPLLDGAGARPHRTAPTWGPWALNLPDTERAARCRALAMAVRLHAGPAGADAVEALRRAEADPETLPDAAAAFDRLPTLYLRRALASFAALHRPRRDAA